METLIRAREHVKHAYVLVIIIMVSKRNASLDMII